MGKFNITPFASRKLKKVCSLSKSHTEKCKPRFVATQNQNRGKHTCLNTAICGICIFTNSENNGTKTKGYTPPIEQKTSIFAY